MKIVNLFDLARHPCSELFQLERQIEHPRHAFKPRRPARLAPPIARLFHHEDGFLGLQPRLTAGRLVKLPPLNGFFARQSFDGLPLKIGKVPVERHDAGSPVILPAEPLHPPLGAAQLGSSRNQRPVRPQVEIRFESSKGFRRFAWQLFECQQTFRLFNVARHNFSSGASPTAVVEGQPDPRRAVPSHCLSVGLSPITIKGMWDLWD